GFLRRAGVLDDFQASAVAGRLAPVAANRNLVFAGEGLGRGVDALEALVRALGEDIGVHERAAARSLPLLARAKAAGRLLDLNVHVGRIGAVFPDQIDDQVTLAEGPQDAP